MTVTKLRKKKSVQTKKPAKKKVLKKMKKQTSSY